MMSKFKVLIVEDDLNLGFLLMDLLETANYHVKLCRDGTSGLRAFESNQYDLGILDIMMPKLDGFSLAKIIQKKQIRTPYLFLTAKSMKEDKLKGYGLGAEDYIVKPFDEDELLCKINVILRKQEIDDLSIAPTQFSIGHYSFDYERQELLSSNCSKRLTEKENEVLRLLCLNKNKVLKRQEAVLQIYGKEDYFLGRSFDVYVSRLRKLLGDDPNVEIQNVYKVGFMLNEKKAVSG